MRNTEIEYWNYLIYFTLDIISGSYSLESVEKSVQDFASYFETLLKQIIYHDFVSQKQSQYFSKRKTDLDENEVLIVCDFSENYTFIIQDAIQSYHWSNKQCTIHPFALYWKEANESKMLSIVVIADSLKHDVIAVYLFQKGLIKYIQDHIGKTKLTFFSDGAGGQYKNRKNFANICQYKGKYDLDIEWHFFATSHGKSAYEGIGGTFKRNARRASLQRPENPITEAKQLYEWAKTLQWNSFFIQIMTTKMLPKN